MLVNVLSLHSDAQTKVVLCANLGLQERHRLANNLAVHELIHSLSVSPPAAAEGRRLP